MPRYVFRCPHCSIEFDISRPMIEAAKVVECPRDHAPCERIFTAPMMNRGAAQSSETPASNGDAGGQPRHGHGFGPDNHSHFKHPRDVFP